jgi:putative ATPase
MPEGDQALGQLTLYLSLAPKSDAAYRALNEASGTVATRRAEPVPLHLRNAPTKLMKEVGYSKGYEHAHQNRDAITPMSCLPESLAGMNFYQPTQRGFERNLSERLEWLKQQKERQILERSDKDSSDSAERN